LLAGVFLLGHSPPEPEYEGIKLGDWAKNYPRNQDVVDNAIRHMGTNALPWLLEWLSAEPPPRWKLEIVKSAAKLPAHVGGDYSKKALWTWGWESMNRSSFAQHSFYFLGKEARSAMPDLVRIASNPKHQQGGKAAASILIGFHEEGVHGFITILRSPQAPGRRPATDYFRVTGVAKLGTNANAAAEALASCLDDDDPLTRNDAAIALAKLAIRPGVVVPALAKSVTDPDAQVRISTLAALAAYGDSARSAMPAVRKALDDSDSDVRTMAAYAWDQVR
jgi:hypothetical protein